jgi:MmyB-like transcription regulator ligand binding domain
VFPTADRPPVRPTQQSDVWQTQEPGSDPAASRLGGDQEYRSLTAPADGQVDRPGGARCQRDGDDLAALLRAEAVRDPYGRGLSDLMRELSARSDQFRVRWAAHNVRIHSTGVKLIHHPAVGDIELPFESFLLAADPSQCLLTYTAEPGSPSQDALSLLASWAASTAHDSHASKH